MVFERLEQWQTFLSYTRMRAILFLSKFYPSILEANDSYTEFLNLDFQKHYRLNALQPSV